MPVRKTHQEKINGKVLTLSTVDGIKNGLARLETSGKIEFECFYVNDLLDGRFIRYYSSGNVLSIVNYEKGILQGGFVSFYESGVKQVTGTYKSGVYNGLLKTYDEFGDIIKVEPYVDGKLSGKVVSYYSRCVSSKSSSGVMEIAFFENGLLHGNKMTFSPDGKVMSVTPYYHGRPLRYSIVRS